MQSDQYSQLMWQNANVTVAPNMATYSNFYVAQNSATLDIGYLDGNSSPQFKEWLWSVDGNLTLPSGGYILNSDNSIYGGGTGTYTGNITTSGATSYFVGNASPAIAGSTASSVGYMGLPQSGTSTSATLAIGDAGKHIYVTTNSQTITIPAASSVAYPIGTTLTFIAGPSATTVTIAITSDTMYLAGTGTTGSRTLAAHGMATAVKVSGLSSAGVWYINGSGLT
jgi:hypothetical protein